jgi:hypothetical protein
MRKLSFSKKTTAIVAAGLLTVATAGGAYAYWTSSGSGSGSATTGTTATITVNQVGVPTGLYPSAVGVGTQELSGTFTNSNASPVTITSVTATVTSISGGGTADATHPACVPADYAIAGTSGANTVPVGTLVGSWTGLNIQMVDNGLNQDTCKGATPIITYSAN